VNEGNISLLQLADHQGEDLEERYFSL